MLAFNPGPKCTKCDQGFELKTTEKQSNPASDRVEALKFPGPPDYPTCTGGIITVNSFFFLFFFFFFF